MLKMNNKTLIIICGVVITLPVVYYFCYALPQHNKALQEIELQKLEYQKQQDKEKAEQERIKQQKADEEKRKVDEEKRLEKEKNNYEECMRIADKECDGYGYSFWCNTFPDWCTFTTAQVEWEALKLFIDSCNNMVLDCKRRYPEWAELSLIKSIF